jgi:putative sterol carrier protein
MIAFPSDEWAKLFMQELNASKSYEEAAINWEGDFLFNVDAGGNLTAPVSLYMDLFHGKCRDAYMVKDGNKPQTVFSLTGKPEAWKKVMTKKMDPMQAMMTGQLKLVGNMSIVMKNVRAAKELVETCTKIETEFPV